MQPLIRRSSSKSGQAPPIFKEHAVNVQTILCDNGREYCGCPDKDGSRAADFDPGLPVYPLSFLPCRPTVLTSLAAFLLRVHQKVNVQVSCLSVL